MVVGEFGIQVRELSDAQRTSSFLGELMVF